MLASVSSRVGAAPRRAAACRPQPQRLQMRHAALCRAPRASDGDSPSVASFDSSALTELTKDDFWEYLKGDEQKGKTIIVDCFTDWCGPCKLILPDLVAYSEELGEKGCVVKFNCNKYNKELGVKLNIKVAPTFLIYQDGEQVGKMTGAKVDKLKTIVADLMAQQVAVPAK